MCETDYSGYPDCRDDTIKALQVAISLGLDTRLVLETPLMWIDKAATWKLAKELGGEKLLELVREDTHTCYMGDRTYKYDWGYGCNACPSCDLRRIGYENFMKVNT
jgi:7-cyano-7-deazaguanine synthase